MKLKMNPVVMLLAALFLAGAVTVIVRSPDKTPAPARQGGTVPALSPEDLRELGIEGDTAQDTLKTLVGKIRSLDRRQGEQEDALSEKDKENTRLRQEQEKMPDRISRAVDEAKEASRTQIARLEAELDKLRRRQKDTPDTPDASPPPFPPGGGDSTYPVSGGQPQTTPVPDSQGLLWVEPQDARRVDRNGNPLADDATTRDSTLAFPTVFGDTVQRLESAAQKTKKELDGSTAARDARPGIPFWTLPENSTLMGSVAMTALIGRVPIDGNVTDPYPFKVIIGPENLTANGIDLPDVEAAILSGTATGDWVLSCVRGTLTSFTLVFSDGRIRTLTGASRSGNGNSAQGQGIGWLSDDNGIPCVSGERKTNAGTYLPTLFALSGAEAAADSMATSQTSATTSGDSVLSSLTGSAGQYALGRGLSGGTSAAAEWFRKRYGQMFDAVYVRPGAEVAIHISRQLEIDYEEDGRLVHYGRALSGAETAALD